MPKVLPGRPDAAGIALALCLIGGPTAEAVQRPQFGGNVDVVAVDANVVDDQGRPVRDMALEEFAVKVDGRQRRVLSSEFVDLGTVVAAPAPAGIRDGADAAQGTVGRSAGRLVVLVVDRGELSAGAVHKATQAASRFLERLSPADRAAVFSLPSGPRLDFTSDRASVAAALGRIGPAQDIVPGQAATLRERLDAHLRSATDRLNALEALIRNMAEIPDPKVMVVISGGLTALEAPMDPPMEREGRAARDPQFGLSGQLAAGVVQHLRRIATAAAAARTTFYSVYVSDRAAGSEASNSLYDLSNVSESVNASPGFRVAALETLTAMNGGAMFEIVAGADRAFERVASEISGQYLLGLEPADGDRDGKPHTIEVKVRRKRVEVRARRQFVIVAPTRGGRP